MAARRLIIVMLFLLGVSTAIAIVVPEPREPDQQEESGTTGETGATGSTGATGASGATGATGSDGEPGEGDSDNTPGLVEETVEPAEKPVAVEAAAGDRLVLTVETGRNVDVEIPELGLLQTTTEFAPAVFDIILPSEPAKIEVVAGAGEAIAFIDTER